MIDKMDWHQPNLREKMISSIRLYLISYADTWNERFIYSKLVHGKSVLQLLAFHLIANNTKMDLERN